MSETFYKKFCNSVDAYPPMAAFAMGIVGMIFLMIPYALQPVFAFIPVLVSNNIYLGFWIIGIFLILVPVFRLAIYPLLRFNN